MNTLDLTGVGPGVSGPMVGAGVWLFVGWCWWLAREARVRTVAVAGLVGAAAFGGGIVKAAVVGGFGLSSLGALTGAGLAVALLVVGTRVVDVGTLDVLVPGGIAGLSLARLGCLFEGCDFGRIAEAGPAVVYGSGTRAWEVHVAEYGLAATGEASLAVHAFAGYLAVWGILCAVVGEWWRSQDARPGRAGLMTAVAFLVGGGVIEWWREPATVIEWTDGVSMYPLLYWAVALVVVAASRAWLQSRGGER